MVFLFTLLLGMFLGWFFISPPSWARYLLRWMIAKFPPLGWFSRH